MRFADAVPEVLTLRTERKPPRRRPSALIKEEPLFTLLFVVLIVLLVGTIPTWRHSRNWGYAPSGGLGLVLVVLAILMLSGRF
jgi:uncharacterized protein DUF3309